MNPLFSPNGKVGAKGDAKWWTSIRCMFDSLCEFPTPKTDGLWWVQSRWKLSIPEEAAEPLRELKRLGMDPGQFYVLCQGVP